MDQLVPGQDVEVRTRLDGSWVDGFLVEEAVDRGYRLRRLLDDSLLPDPIAAPDVRARAGAGGWFHR